MNQPISLQAGTRIDDYEITDTLWTTNSGFIYRAREIDKERDVLLQEYLPPNLATRHWSGIHVMPLEGLAEEFDLGLTRFLREARILAQINDPYVCRVYEYTEANATAYMVLDHEPGRTLQDYLSEMGGRLDEAGVRRLLVPLLKGLRVAHAADLLHRDIHPANIYLRDVGPPVLIGFGSPVLPPRGDGDPHLESRVAPGYTPVEQYQSDARTGPWSDLYALGAVMYRCLSGTVPVEATRRVTEIAQENDDPLVPAMEIGRGDYSPALLSAIDWMLEPMASNRPQDAGAVLGPLTEDAGPQAAALPPERMEPVLRSAAASAPAAAPDNAAGRARTPAPRAPMPVVDPPRTGARQTRRRTSGRGYWGLPLALIVAGIMLTGVFVLYQPAELPSGPSTAEAPQPRVPAVPTEEDYEPPDLPAEVKFDREGDAERAAEYRQLESRTRQVEAALAQAQAHMDAGRLTAPPGNNALESYRSVLSLDPDQADARLGIGAIRGGILADAESAFAAGDIDAARMLLEQASALRGDSGRVDALRREIDRHVSAQQRQAAIARTESERREQARERAERQRRARVEALLDKAGAATADGRVTAPAGDNALSYYRRVLRLDPGNTPAREGITNIGRRFLDQASDAIALDELDRAASLLGRAERIVPDNETAPLLRKQLDTRRAVLEARAEEQRRRRQQAELERLEAQRARLERLEQARLERAREQAASRRALPGPGPDAAAGPATETAAGARSNAAEATPPPAPTQDLQRGVAAYYRGDYDIADRLLRPLANDGNARAGFRLAMMYYHGRGVEQDIERAEALVRDALPGIRAGVDAGEAWAQSDLASLYADGIVLAENDKEALRLYRLAAEQGYAGAQTNLGVMYANGEGVFRSRQDAIAWLRRAAAQGDRIAQQNLEALGVE